MGKYILAIDQGTTSTRSCLVAQNGSLVAMAQQPFPQIFPKPGWVEHDPEAIWDSFIKTLHQIFRNHPIDAKEIVGCGITNQRETVVAWDADTGKPLYNAIVWQCRRSQPLCDKLKKEKKEKWIQKKTGLVIDPYFSTTKMHWLLKNVPAVKSAHRRGKLRFGTMDTFLVWRLTQGASYITDVSNASRTLLMNLDTLNWDDQLLDLFELHRSELPQITSSSGNLGFIRGLRPLQDGTPISGIAGDQQAALFGQSCFTKGEVKCTFGTGSFILLNTGTQKVRSQNRMLTTVAWKIKEEAPVYALEGGAFICGAAVQWLRDGLHLLKSSEEIEKLAQQVSTTEGVYFVPAFVGLGAPYWRPEARGLISGIHRGTTQAHLARATLEAMALQNAEIFEVFKNESGQKIKNVKVDGGATKNNLLLQLQSDYSGLKIIRPQNQETTVMGAAYLAGLGCGLWTSLKEIKDLWSSEKEFTPKISLSKRSQKMIEWKKAVKKSFS